MTPSNHWMRQTAILLVFGACSVVSRNAAAQPTPNVVDSIRATKPNPSDASTQDQGDATVDADESNSSAETVLEMQTPLADAVAAFNERQANYRFDVVRPRSPAVPEENWPAPLTVDVVVEACLASASGDSLKDAKARELLLRIGESKMLPPKSQIELRDVWLDNDATDRFEYRTWWVLLEVMTSETTGATISVHRHVLDRRVAMRPDFGYSWRVGPAPTTLGNVNTNGLIRILETSTDGSLIATVARSLRPEEQDVRMVVFDDEARRYVLDQTRIGPHDDGGGPLVMERYRLAPDVLPAEEAKFYGFEALDIRRLGDVSRKALGTARDRGMHVLPLPVVGEHFEFALMSDDGELIDSRQLQGKVILIDCWATWCGPCMRGMPDLIKTYEKWHTQGLEIVGISFDEKSDVAEAAFRKLGIDWDLVVVPGGDESRTIWKEANRISSLPRVLLIDRDGVLRVDLTSANEIEKNLELEVARLINPATSTP
jgi:thiol-disulfide isomerase/thioredoxin